MEPRTVNGQHFSRQEALQILGPMTLKCGLCGDWFSFHAGCTCREGKVVHETRVAVLNEGQRYY